MGEFPDEIFKVSTNKRAILLPKFLLAQAACMMGEACSLHYAKSAHII